MLQAMLRYLQNLYQRHAAHRMFSSWSPSYEEDVARNQYSAPDAVATAALKYLAAAPLSEPQIADIGIGTGLLAQQIYDAIPCRIVGLDFTEDMMAIALQREVTELLIKCDAGKDHWPLEDGSYDAVISAGLLEYFTPAMAHHFLSESQRILKPSGYLIFTYVPSQEAVKNEKLWFGKSGAFLSCTQNPQDITQKIEDLGFAILEHGQPFTGSVFKDGSRYSYRLIAAQKQVRISVRSLHCRAS